MVMMTIVTAMAMAMAMAMAKAMTLVMVVIVVDVLRQACWLCSCQYQSVFRLRDFYLPKAFTNLEFSSSQKLHMENAASSEA